MNWGLKFSSPLYDEEGGKVHLRDFLLSKQITDGVDKRGVVVTSRLLSRFDNPNTQTF